MPTIRDTISVCSPQNGTISSEQRECKAIVTRLSGRHKQQLPFVLHDAQSEHPRLDADPATMAPATLLVCACALLAVIGVIQSVRQCYALRDFGGHWSAGWSRLWLLKAQSSGEMNKRFTDINQRYGKCHPLRKPLPSLAWHI
ncbi:hypothetical protein DOTSEDRAFT_33703 [Dothistroma septosporum NZE10]|uniref:Uncharacterized protein n=1 Tax=Dothistroma septosporum (strain NZE10 / CBS 128990) TaxID=675120 RepID=N1PRU0_DOTSN|nr:hypothetical protein DOTSEDRAFT_33703 [Dothistroma septosporum NZE10]